MIAPDIAASLQITLWQHKPAEYFSDCLHIQDKATGKIQPLTLNKHQRKIQDVIDAERRKGKPVRIQVLKPRQTGISTVCCANVFHGVRFGGGIGMTVSLDLDSAEHLHTIDQRFYFYLPEGEKHVLKTVASNRKELKFEEPHGGRILIETAGKTSAGHSFTVRHLHLSEVPRWPEGCEDSIVGLLNAVPYEPDTTIIVEGVANGMSGWFYEEWNDKVSDYVKVFLPWFEHSEYQRELPIAPTLYEAQLEPVERRLVAQYNLTLEQVEWRRWATRNNCQGDPEKFKEQYPSNPQEAFVASGNTFFHQPTLEAVTPNEPMRGDLRVFEDLSKAKETRFVPNSRGLLRMWKKPQVNHEYVVGADVAEGIEIDGAPADDRHDYSSADILDRDTGEQVAQLHGRITPDEFGRQLALLGRFYNNAYLGVENNGGYGLHVCTTLIDEEYPQHLIFKDALTKKWGWTTTRSNRKSLCSNLDQALRRQECFVNSDESLRELRSFVTKPDGRIEAGSGAKDDRVFSLAIAYKMLELAPPRQTRTISPRSDVAPTTMTKYKPFKNMLERPTL